MNGFKAIGIFCLVFSSVFLIYGVYRGWIAEGPNLSANENWHNFVYTFTPFALQAIALCAVGGMGVYYGWRQQKTLNQKQPLTPQNANPINVSSAVASFAYCPFCGKELPQGNYPLCPFCGKSFGVFHN